MATTTDPAVPIQTKNPRRFPAEGLCSNTHDHAIRDRSRGARGTGTTSCPDRSPAKSEIRRWCEGDRDRTATDRQTVERGRTVQLGIHHVQTHVEVLGDVPLGARTDPPSAPVAITAVGHGTTGAEPAPEALGSAAVADLRITAVQRCTPARAPEVLVGRVDVPGRGQFKRGCSRRPVPFMRPP